MARMTPLNPVAARGALAALTVAAALLLGGCGKEITPASVTGGSDALTIQSTGSLPPMYLQEPYAAPVAVSGGAGPYSLRVTAGSLPPGITLNSAGLQLTGKPEKAGTYTFTLETTDSRLNSKSREFTVTVAALPPLTLAPTLPAGEIRGETRVPVTITHPRDVRAARVVWTLPEGARVTRVQLGDGNGSGLLFVKQTGQQLTVDLGFRAVPRSGARVLLVSVKPARAVKLTSTGFTYEARDGTGKVIAGSPAAATPAPATPAAGTPSPTATPTPPVTSPTEPGTPPAETPGTPPPSGGGQ